MDCYLFKTEQEKNGYFNRNYYLQGVGLNGVVPIRICKFLKPVMEPVLEKVVDVVTGKPKLDKDGKEQYFEKKDKDGNVVMQAKKDEDGKDILRDDDFRVRDELLSMFAAMYKSGEVCKPVPVYLQPKKADDNNDYFFIKIGKKSIPIEVIDFSTDTRNDYAYRGNVEKLRYLAGNS